MDYSSRVQVLGVHSTTWQMSHFTSRMSHPIRQDRYLTNTIKGHVLPITTRSYYGYRFACRIKWYLDPGYVRRMIICVCDALQEPFSLSQNNIREPMSLSQRHSKYIWTRTRQIMRLWQFLNQRILRIAVLIMPKCRNYQLVYFFHNFASSSPKRTQYLITDLQVHFRKKT